MGFSLKDSDLQVGLSPKKTNQPVEIQPQKRKSYRRDSAPNLEVGFSPKGPNPKVGFSPKTQILQKGLSPKNNESQGGI